MIQRRALRKTVDGTRGRTIVDSIDGSLVGFCRKNDVDLRYIVEGGLGLDLRILYWTTLKIAGLRSTWVYPRVGNG